MLSHLVAHSRPHNAAHFRRLAATSSCHGSGVLANRHRRDHPHRLALGRGGGGGCGCRRHFFSFSGAAAAVRECYLSCASSAPVTLVGSQLCALHDLSGLAWCGVIAGVTCTLRGAMLFPAHVTSQKTTVKRSVLFQQLDKQLIPFLRQEVRKKQLQRGWTDRVAKAKFDKIQKQLVKDKVVEYNCAATKIFLPFLLQIPLWISVSMALRRMAGTLNLDTTHDALVRSGEFASEGALWFPNLTLADQTMALPVILGSLYLANVALHANNHSPSQERPRSTKLWTGLFAAMSVMMVPIACYVPSAVALYWATSAASGLAVSLAVMSPKIRNACNIPLMPGESEQPYSRVMANARTKLGKVLRIHS